MLNLWFQWEKLLCASSPLHKQFLSPGMPSFYSELWFVLCYPTLFIFSTGKRDTSWSKPGSECWIAPKSRKSLQLPRPSQQKDPRTQFRPVIDITWGFQKPRHSPRSLFSVTSICFPLEENFSPEWVLWRASGAPLSLYLKVYRGPSPGSNGTDSICQLPPRRPSEKMMTTRR